MTAEGQRKKENQRPDSRGQHVGRADHTDGPVGTSPWARQARHGPDPALRQRKTGFPAGALSPTPGERKSSRRC